jgi:hypothetical protein
MSFLIHHTLALVSLLLVAVGGWISFRNRDPRRSFESTLGNAVIQLAVTIVSMTGIKTDVSIDSWSTGDWIVGVVIAMMALLTAYSFGRAFEMRSQKKSGAGEAQRVGTGFSPR